MKLQLTFACGEYDRTYPLRDGTVPIEGIELNYLPMATGEIFRRQARHAEFPCSEFSLSTYMMLHGRGDRRFIGIPVYPSRRFRHNNIYVNLHAGIKRPEDLNGKRIGTLEYQQTAGVWIRGFLQDDYGVKTEDIEWWFGPFNRPRSDYSERVEVDLPEWLRTRAVPAGTCQNEMLESGELDAIISSIKPLSLVNKSPNVDFLFPNYPEVEADYYRRTGILPIMHVVVLRRDVYEQAPWAARSLQKAFEQAKQVAMQRLTTTHEGPTTLALPWLHYHVRETLERLGPDYWSYGFQRNRKQLELIAQYSLQQGLIREPLNVEELFAPETLADIDLGSSLAGPRMDV
jgi:4,5-dihydroxyphthalate decarboxylase